MTALIAAAWSLLSDKLKAAILLTCGLFAGLLIAWSLTTLSYEGLRLPLVGQVIDGRLQTAVKAATGQLVARAEYDALAAVIAKKELDEQASRAASAALRGRLSAAEREQADAEKRLDDELAANSDAGRAVVTDADQRWMQQH